MGKGKRIGRGQYSGRKGDGDNGRMGRWEVIGPLERRGRRRVIKGWEVERGGGGMKGTI